MAFIIHDTVHVEKRARQRRFTLDQATMTINEPGSILKTPPRRGNHGGMIWLFFRSFGAKMLVVVAETKNDECWLIMHIGTNGVKTFVIPITEPPVVELDTEATAAYVRLRRTSVARTEPYGSEQGLVMIDFDAAGDVVGIEMIGQQEFTIRELIKQIPVEVEDAVLDGTRYVAADLQTA